MNVVNLFTRTGIYARDMDNWVRKPLTNQAYCNLRSFIQAAYQRCPAPYGSYVCCSPHHGSQNDKLNHILLLG